MEDESLLSEINSDGVAQSGFLDGRRLTPAEPKTDDDVLKALGVTCAWCCGWSTHD